MQQFIPRAIATAIKGGQTSDIKGLVSDIASHGIQNIPGISSQAKEALTGLKDQIASRISTPVGQTIGQVLKPNVSSPSAKPTVESPAAKPSGPTYNYLSGWDKFKNKLSKIGKIGGLTTHEITDADYVKNPKTGKMEFSWDAARAEDKRRGLATKTEFDQLPAIGAAVKIASKFI